MDQIFKTLKFKGDKGDKRTRAKGKGKGKGLGDGKDGHKMGSLVEMVVIKKEKPKKRKSTDKRKNFGSPSLMGTQKEEHGRELQKVCLKVSSGACGYEPPGVRSLFQGGKSS